jgi:hypothetical protein
MPSRLRQESVTDLELATLCLDMAGPVRLPPVKDH